MVLIIWLNDFGSNPIGRPYSGRLVFVCTFFQKLPQRFRAQHVANRFSLCLRRHQHCDRHILNCFSCLRGDFFTGRCTSHLSASFCQDRLHGRLQDCHGSDAKHSRQRFDAFLPPQVSTSRVSFLPCGHFSRRGALANTPPHLAARFVVVARVTRRSLVATAPAEASRTWWVRGRTAIAPCTSHHGQWRSGNRVRGSATAGPTLYDNRSLRCMLGAETAAKCAGLL